VPKFLFKASYSPEGAKGVASRGGSARVEAIEKLFESNGGKLETFYFAFGDADVYAIGDLPDNQTAAAIAIAINADGRTTVSTVVLLTPDEIDAATKTEVGYRAPGA
jgi:uncharacterized protein with GYD domain